MKIKKKIFFITVISIWLQASAIASADTSQIINSTKNIKYISQNIAKEYLYLYKHPNRDDIKALLKNNIKNLEENFRFIAKNTNNEDSKNVLDFLSYSKDQIKSIIDKNVKSENRELILDQVEALSEGAESILSSYNYDSLADGDIKINLAKISKLYMAINSNINKSLNQAQIEKEIKIIDTKLANSNNREKESWHTLKELLISNKNQFIPNIISILVKNLESM